ncbi:MAG: transposase, partial [Acidimicrobiales bacterium]
ALVLSSGRPIVEVARELGVTDTSLGTWVRAGRRGAKLTGGSSGDDPGQMADENRRMRKRIAELEKEREILKRATAFWVRESNG